MEEPWYSYNYRDEIMTLLIKIQLQQTTDVKQLFRCFSSSFNDYLVIDIQNS